MGWWINLVLLATSEVARHAEAIAHCARDLPRLSATASALEVAETLQTYGAVVIERRASNLTMARLSSDLQHGGRFHGSKGAFATPETTRNPAKPLGESSIARELAVDETVVAAAEKVLRPFCRRIILGTCSAINVEPPIDDEGSAQVLHREESMWAASAWTTNVHYSVSVMWAVTDFTSTNGATRVAVGSHMTPRSEFPLDDVAVAEMKAGDVILWLGGVLHGAGPHAPPSVDNSTRQGLLFIYNLGWLRSEHNFHNAIPRHIIGSFDEDLKTLLGYHGQNAIEHEWFTGPVYAQPYLGGHYGPTSGDGVQYKIDNERVALLSQS